MAGRSYGFSPAGYEFDEFDDDLGGFAFGGDSDEEFDDVPVASTASVPVTEKVNINGATSNPMTTASIPSHDTFQPFTVERKHTPVVHLPTVPSPGKGDARGCNNNNRTTPKKEVETMAEDPGASMRIRTSVNDIRRNKGVRRHCAPHHIVSVNSVHVPVVPIDDFRVAVIKNNVEAVERFLKQGLVVDTVFKSGWTSLMYATSCAHKETVRLLLERGADPNFHKDHYTVLMAACASSHDKEDHILACVDLLLEKGANGNSFDRFHMAPLMYAAREGCVKVVKQLIELKVDIDKQDTRGYTALMWASCRGHIRVVHALLEGGADAKKQCSDGSRAVDLAGLNGLCQLEELLKKYQSAPNATTPRVLPDIDLLCAPGKATTLSTDTKSQTSALEPATHGFVYGELELFLSGLDLGHLIETFQQNQVTFAQFLRMTDSDLQQVGVKQMGSRKKILDGIRQTHKKDWEPSSLTSIMYNKQISCAEAIAMVANINKHTLYVGSTIGYVSDQIQADDSILKKAQEGANGETLCTHTENAITNTKNLFDELVRLRQHLAKVSQNEEFHPPDLIESTQPNKKPWWRKRRYLLLGGAAVTGLLWKRRELLDQGITLASNVMQSFV